MLADQLLLAPNRICTDGAGTYLPAIVESREVGLLPQAPLHYVTLFYSTALRATTSE